MAGTTERTTSASAAAQLTAVRFTDRHQARLAHPSGWRARAERAVAEQSRALDAEPAISRAVVTLDGGPRSLVLRVECQMVSEAVSLDVMRLLNDELPARIEESVGLPLTERHVALTIAQYLASDAA